MYAVRCSGQRQGFCVEGRRWAFAYWTLVPEVSEAVRRERMLTVLEVAGADDPRLSPFPVVEGVKVFSQEDRAAAIDSRLAQLEALTAAQADEIAVLKGQIGGQAAPATAKKAGG